MKPAGPFLLILSSLAFIASSLLYAVHPISAPAPPMAGLGGASPFGTEAVFLDLGGQFLQPGVTAMAALLLTTWVVLAFHAIRRLMEQRESGAVDHRNEDGLLILGLTAGAIWPWLREPQPTIAILLCAVMLAGVLGAALSAMRLGGRLRISAALGFAAGWATLVTCAAFATFLQIQLAAPVTLAAGVAILIAAIASVQIQLQLGGTISYSIAVIWGMIGLAAGSIAVEAALAMMAVLAIAVIAVALVRVTT